MAYKRAAPAAPQERLGVMSEHRVNPDDLLGSHKYRKDKEERMAAVLAGGLGGGLPAACVAPAGPARPAAGQLS